MLRFLFTYLLMMAVAASFAQSKKKKARTAEVPAASQPSSLSPNRSEEKKYEPTKKQRPTRKVTYNATEKFYDRQEAIAKQERKAEKEMAKPENSDPLYFGHKRPPKKRPPNKMKYCKTCGIRH